MQILKDQNGREFEITALTGGACGGAIFHVRLSADGTYKESLLTRYNVLRDPV